MQRSSSWPMSNKLPVAPALTCPIDAAGSSFPSQKALLFARARMGPLGARLTLLANVCTDIDVAFSETGQIWHGACYKTAARAGSKHDSSSSWK